MPQITNRFEQGRGLISTETYSLGGSDLYNRTPSELEKNSAVFISADLDGTESGTRILEEVTRYFGEADYGSLLGLPGRTQFDEAALLQSLTRSTLVTMNNPLDEGRRVVLVDFYYGEQRYLAIQHIFPTGELAWAFFQRLITLNKVFERIYFSHLRGGI
ncbi:MAG: hypothetical protein QY318_03795 [Candidatus Dojkabacteria bacterium]|nr:MAG: hypothetical protein QY318_03795 [Candidatus Dojkabacteria bacterium]